MSNKLCRLRYQYNHIRSAREGLVIATASPYHIGRSTQVWDIKIKNEQDKLISVNRLTMSVLQQGTTIRTYVKRHSKLGA